MRVFIAILRNRSSRDVLSEDRDELLPFMQRSVTVAYNFFNDALASRETFRTLSTFPNHGNEEVSRSAIRRLARRSRRRRMDVFLNARLAYGNGAHEALGCAGGRRRRSNKDCRGCPSRRAIGRRARRRRER